MNAETPALVDTSLDPLETEPDWPDPLENHWSDGAAARFARLRHSGWETNRRKVWKALRDTGQSSSRKQNFEDCGRHAWLAQKEAAPGEFRLVADHCHDRFCIPCQNETARRTARVVYEFLKTKRVRFLTLTLKHHHEPLEDLLDRLTACFTRLRERKQWTDRVSGGIAFLEVTWHSSHGWHPHLHVIVEGKFFPQHLLQKLWSEVTTDSKIVHIEAVKDAQRAAEYVAKYATKGWSNTVFSSPEVLREAITALKGRKLLKTFGTWRGFRISDDHDDEKWLPLCSLDELHDRAVNGDVYAIDLIRHLENPTLHPTPGSWVPRSDTAKAPAKEREPPVQHTLEELCNGVHERSLMGTPEWRKYW